VSKEDRIIAVVDAVIIAMLEKAGVHADDLAEASVQVGRACWEDAAFKGVTSRRMHASSSPQSTRSRRSGSSRT